MIVLKNKDGSALGSFNAHESSTMVADYMNPSLQKDSFDMALPQVRVCGKRRYSMTFSYHELEGSVLNVN